MTLVVVAADCSRPDANSDRARVPVAHAVGTWAGSGNHTIGFTSDSGRFRVRWETRSDDGRGNGRFHLAVHSAVSGRLLQDIVDQEGPGQGAVNFEDDPRQYDLMVTSSGLAWSIAVDEVVLARPVP